MRDVLAANNEEKTRHETRHFFPFVQNPDRRLDLRHNPFRSTDHDTRSPARPHRPGFHCQRMGQNLSPERQGDPPQGNLQKPLRHHPGGRFVPAQRGQRQTAGHCRGRPLWRGEGAVFRPLRPDPGRARFCDPGLRSVLHRRERRFAPQCALARHQHRGFFRGGGFSRPAGECGP